MKNIKIAPSILSADFSNLAMQIVELDNSDADWIHIDVMDGNFVPNLTFGSMIVEQIRPFTDKIFDVHLMVNNPENHIDNFIKAGADQITFHYEAYIHHDRLISYIKSKGLRVGIAINPSTSENVLEYLIDKIDLVLVMTVNPGFGGQKFLDSQIQKVKNISSRYGVHSNLDIVVDGGISLTNASFLVKAGANVLVAGKSLFFNNKLSDNISSLRKELI